MSICRWCSYCSIAYVSSVYSYLLFFFIISLILFVFLYICFVTFSLFFFLGYGSICFAGGCYVIVVWNSLSILSFSCVLNTVQIVFSIIITKTIIVDIQTICTIWICFSISKNINLVALYLYSTLSADLLI